MANGLTGPSQSFGQPLFVSQATPVTNVGTEAITADGRHFRYVKNGATATVAGSMYQTAAELTNHDHLTPAAAAIGATTITLTLGATAVTENQYAGGLLTIDSAPGEGYDYFILSHPAADASATCVFTIDAPGVIVAITTASEATLTPSPYSAIVVAPATTLTGAVVGVAKYVIAASEYGWIQTKGPCGVLIGGTPGVGVAVVSPGSNAGEVVVDGAAAATQVVGAMMVAGAAGEINQVMLNLP
jgi:hypothetical protein